MSPNSYQSHFFILPEDDANRQLANGFLLHTDFASCFRQFQVLPPAGGWGNAVAQLKATYFPVLRKNQLANFILVIDFDNRPERKGEITQQIPADLQRRVFVLGCLREPEDLKRENNFPASLEKIGTFLYEDCKGAQEFWKHPLLQHNRRELELLREALKTIM